MDVNFDDLGLTPEQSIFVKVYVCEGNGTKAAIAAGYSQKTAASQASRLLKSEKIQKALARIRASVVNKVNEPLTVKANLEAATSTAEAIAITAENLMMQLAKMGLTKDLLAKFLTTEDGHLVYNFDGATEEEKLIINAQISEIQYFSDSRTTEDEDGKPVTVKTVRSKVKWMDHKGIIELMGRYKEIMAWPRSDADSGDIHIHVTRAVVGNNNPTAALADPARVAQVIDAHRVANG